MALASPSSLPPTSDPTPHLNTHTKDPTDDSESTAIGTPAPVADSPTKPADAPLPSVETADARPPEVMSESNSDWEKVEKPVVSPPRPRQGIKARDGKDEGGLKGKVGEVKRVLKSGVFGGSPRPATAPKTAPTKPLTSSTTARTSLAPAKKSMPPPSATATTRPSLLTRASSSKDASGAVKPSTTGAGVRARLSTLTKPTASAASRAEGVKPAAKPAASASGAAVRSAATARTASAGKAPLAGTAKTESRPVRESPTGSASTTTARPRQSLAPAKTTVAPASRAVSKDATPAVRGAVASRTAGAAIGAGPGVAILKEEKEAAEKQVAKLQTQVEIVEKNLAEVKAEHEALLAQKAQERADLEASHASALQALTVQHGVASGEAQQAADKQLEELKQIHARELALSQEERELARQELEQRLAELVAAKESIAAELTTALDQLHTTQSELATATATAAEQQTTLADLRAQIDKHGEVLADRDSTLKHAEWARATILQEKGGLEAELAESVARANKAEEELDVLRKAKQEMEGELEGLKAELETAKQVGGDVAVLTAEKAALQENHDVLTDSVSQLRSKLADTEKDLQERRTRIGAMTAEQQALSERISQLLDSEAHQNNHIADLDNTVSDLEKQVAAGEKQLREANERIAQLETGVKEAQEERLVAEQGMAAAQREVEGMKATVAQGTVELEEARVAKEKAEQAVTELKAELDAKAREFEDKHALAVEEAKAKATEHHSQELAALRAQLTDTHAQHQAAHDAELESIAANHAAALSALAAEHSTHLGELKQQVDLAQLEAKQAEEKEKGLVQKIDEAEAHAQVLEGEIQAVKEELGRKGGEGEERLKSALREVEGLRDELEGTKSVLEMNKSHFQTSLEDLQAQHTQELTNMAHRRAVEDEHRDGAHAGVVQDLKAELEAIKVQLDAQVEKTAALAKVDADKRMEKETGEMMARMRDEHADEVEGLKDIINSLKEQLAASSQTHAAAPAASAPEVKRDADEVSPAQAELPVPAAADPPLTPSKIALPATPAKRAPDVASPAKLVEAKEQDESETF